MGQTHFIQQKFVADGRPRQITVWEGMTSEVMAFKLAGEHQLFAKEPWPSQPPHHWAWSSEVKKRFLSTFPSPLATVYLEINLGQILFLPDSSTNRGKLSTLLLSNLQYFLADWRMFWRTRFQTISFPGFFLIAPRTLMLRVFIAVQLALDLLQ